MSEPIKKPTPAELADFCLKCMEDKLAANPIKIKVSPQSSVADWYVIATANSEPQLRALINHLGRQARDVYQLRPLSESGESSSGWMLVDFGTVIVHMMTQEVRDRYNLEGLWGETPAPDAVKTLAEHQP